MSNAISHIPALKNEPVKTYRSDSSELLEVLKVYDQLYTQEIEVPMVINGEKVCTEEKKKITPPHEHQHILGSYSLANTENIEKAITTALEAKKSWEALPWEHRASVFLKAATLIAGPYRAKINAATMLAQSKNVFQAEIDSACELIDFFNFNAAFLEQIYNIQPQSSEGIWNRIEYRALEGFVYAITPFNFTAIAGNLPAAPVLMGNVCVWKPSDSQVYSANVIMEVLEEAGLPKGVINMITGDAEMITKQVLGHNAFSGLHFTGSTHVFKTLWSEIGKNINTYRNYPRIVGETGGKDYIWMHKSAGISEVGTAIIRGAFEYQGQKCSAASRAYLPKSKWEAIKVYLKKEISSIKVGAPRDPSNFVNAVIHQKSFDKLVAVIEKVKKDHTAEIIIGGTYDSTIGYFIDPTIILAESSDYFAMKEEFFGPILTICLYDDDHWEESLGWVKDASEYALTGAIFVKDRLLIKNITEKLSDSAGNFYINDKPTGAVVGQQPFGGGRASGTNDKAGSMFNLLRWVSPRTIKENFNPPTDYRYPFLY